MSVLREDSVCGSRENLTLKDTGKISVLIEEFIVKLLKIPQGWWQVKRRKSMTC